MRKFYTILLLTLAGLSGAWAQQDAIRVSNLNDFREALKNPNANIVLEDDIDFGGNYYTFFSYDNRFHGTIDGMGHRIKNVKVDSDDSYSLSLERHAMIQYAEGATFKNLTLDNVVVKKYQDVAGLVGYSKNCTYEKIFIENSEIYAYESYAGGLVYESQYDTFYLCKTDNDTRVSTHSGTSGTSIVGGLVGRATSSTFTDCMNSADVSGRLSTVGGIVSTDNSCTFIRCINNGYIHHASEYFNDDDKLGGITGISSKSYFHECINNGKLYCENRYGGGIVGNGTHVSIINCLNTSKELKFSTSTCGGIIGYAEKSMVANCLSNADYPLIGKVKEMNPASGNNFRLEIDNHDTNDWVMNVSKKTIASGIVARWLNNGYENRMKNQVVWHQQVNDDVFPYPLIKLYLNEHVVEVEDIEGCMHITSAEELIEFAKKVNNGDKYACAVLEADIDLTNYDWTPIGNHNNRFSGCFDGKGHTIKRLGCSVSSNDDGSGLFGVAYTGAEIRNVIIASGTVTNSGNGGAAGILGGVFIGGTWGNVVIEKCGNYALVAGMKHAGGILGHVNTNTEKGKNIKVMISDCFNMGDIYAGLGNSGLLCGYIKDSGYITYCWSGGTLTALDRSPVDPYDTHGTEYEYFAGYEKNLVIVNCYVTNPDVVGMNAKQIGVEKLSKDALTSGELTYKLNGFVTEGNLSWYQKIGEDAMPKYRSSGGDIVYANIVDNQQFYTNDKELSSFYTIGPIRVKKDGSLALIDGDSKSTIAFNNEIPVGRVELNRKFKANVPSTLMLPFSTEIGTENHVHLYTFEEMQSIIGEGVEYNDFLAVMKEVEDGKIEAYTPYIAMFDEDTDVMVFNNVTLKPAQKAVTERGDWCFVGQNTYREITLDDFYNEKLIFYGYAGMAYDGFKLGEFVILSYGASIAPFRCYLYYKNIEEFPVDIDVVTKKAPTRAMTDGDDGGAKVSREDMPEQIQIVLKGANGETGIGKIDNKTGEFTFDGWYDINGNRVEEEYKGVRVGGGKKVLVKE